MCVCVCACVCVCVSVSVCVLQGRSHTFMNSCRLTFLFIDVKAGFLCRAPLCSNTPEQTNTGLLESYRQVRLIQAELCWTVRCCSSYL